VAEEKVGSSGIDNGGGDRQSRERGGDLESFKMKNETTWGRATIYRFEIISNDSNLKLLLMKVLSVFIRN
jgi:hypothetical protein